MALMQCPSVVSAPTLIGLLYALKAFSQLLDMILMCEMIVVAFPNQSSSGDLRRCNADCTDDFLL